ncbi:hypothetical protein [Aliiroseovarius sp. 2305UL8-7]|uniref:hypothetical protein n=1 Tax=Aliiroseovarius conchicola TaxID=3121637 RepID=UPI0035299831
MRPRREPLFLARQSYRRRRLEDAARLLPVLGAFLFLLPLLAPGAGTARQGLFLFGAWFGLIVATAVISFWLRGGTGPDLSTGGQEQGKDGDTLTSRKEPE